MLDLWTGDAGGSAERAAARTELTHSATALSDWYTRFGGGIVRRDAVPDPQPRDEAAEQRLISAVARDLRGDDGEATATGIRVIWTGDHLDAMRRLEEMLVDPAREALSGTAAP